MSFTGTTESRLTGRFFAALAVFWVVMAVLWWSIGHYAETAWALTVALSQCIFALQHLYWRNRRPRWANVALVALVAGMLIFGYLMVKDYRF